MSLSLFPARAAIGQVESKPVFMTQEFSRALADLLVRVGGPDGMSITAIQKELARRPSTLAQTSEPATVTGTTAAVTMATIKVPADSMGPNGMLRISTMWSVTNNQNEKTIITRFGGAQTSRNAITTVSTYQDEQRIQNRGTGSQIFVFGGFSYTGAGIAKLSMDTTQEQKIEIVGQLASSNDSITLEAYTVELIPTP